MAFLDISIIQQGSSIFVFILVWVLAYAILSFTKIMEAQPHLRSAVALVMAILTLLSPKVSAVVMQIVPWFSLLFIAIIFILIGVMIFGVKEGDITNYIKTSPDGSTITYWVVIISIIIIVSGIGLSFFSGDATTNDGKVVKTIDVSNSSEITSVSEIGSGALLATLFHPKVLGLMFVMLLGLFAAMQLAK